MRIRLLISYDGSQFQGWQKQPGRTTVQGTLENVLRQIYSTPIRVVGSGRTDAGTHAIGQVAHYEAPKRLGHQTKLLRSLNALLPETAVVKAVWEAPDDFHALASARRKTYIYRIWNHPVRSAIWRQRALHIPHRLNLSLLNCLSEEVLGSKDFKSFQNEGTPVKSTVRNIDTCFWHSRSVNLVELRIRGNGFLKQMVRNLVGTMLYLERHGGDREQMRQIFAALNRQAAKSTAPAHGLYLYSVEYPRTLDNRCLKL